MARPWRLARSLDVLRDEIRSRHPRTTFWTIGDAAHVVSDHRPNAAGVVCAADVLGDDGLDLAAFAARLVADPHPALKYVIYNGRIWSKTRAAEGWRRYTGSNPHRTHVHVSVGVGPDGRSTGPYDNTTPWGISRAATTGGIMLPKKGDKGEEVRYWQRLLVAAGETLPRYGTDGHYGDETVRAVASWFKRVSGNTYHGRSITSWIAMHLQREVLGGAGADVGQAVADYLRKHPPKAGVLELPLGVEITGVITSKAD